MSQTRLEDNVYYRRYVQDLLWRVEIEHLQHPLFWRWLHHESEKQIRHLLSHTAETK